MLPLPRCLVLLLNRARAVVVDRRSSIKSYRLGKEFCFGGMCLNFPLLPIEERFSLFEVGGVSAWSLAS